MMEMKYFRFLFCETGGCFLHYGELSDTCTGEHYNFIYVKGTQECADGGEVSEEAPFCFPDNLDMIVVEELNSGTEPVLKRILSHSVTGRLVYPGGGRAILPEFKDRVQEFVRLSGQGSDSQEGELCFRSAGWMFLVKGCAGGKLMMLHRLAKRPPAEKPVKAVCRAAETAGRESGERGKERLIAEHGNISIRRRPENSVRKESRVYYEDCVMNVKEMDSFQRCHVTPEPDGYHCALGCVLHRDHDVCKYRSRNKDNPQLTGVLLLPELPSEDMERTVREAEKDWQEEIRFFVTGRPENILQYSGILPQSGTERHGRKRYFIGLKQTMETDVIAEVCRSGPYRVPVLLEEGRGLCCSGFFRYGEFTV